MKRSLESKDIEVQKIGMQSKSLLAYNNIGLYYYSIENRHVHHYNENF